MSDTLVALLKHCENAERELAEAKKLTMHLFVELADKGYNAVVIPHATHATVIPPGAFCCDVGVDKPDDPPASHH